MSDDPFRRSFGLVSRSPSGSLKQSPRQFHLETGYDVPHEPKTFFGGSTREARQEDANMSASIAETIRVEMARGFQSYLAPHDERLSRIEQSVSSLAESVRETSGSVTALTRDVDRAIGQMETSSKTIDERFTSLWRSVNQLSDTVKEQSGQIRSRERDIDKLLGSLQTIKWILAVLVPIAAIPIFRAIF